MKGPVIKYFCGDGKKEKKDCQHLKFMHYFYICEKTDKSLNLSKETPDWCPYLLKNIRNQKIEKINESGRNL